MSIDSTRLRRFARTFSSWPEYAWTTYQRASLAETALLTAMFILPRRLRRHRRWRGWYRCRCGCCERGGGGRRRGGSRRRLLGDRPLHTQAQQVIRRADEHGEQDHGGDHDAGHAHQLVPRRPDDLLELLPDATQIPEQASPPGSAGSGPGQGGPRCAWAARCDWSLGH